jgi:transposase InsO family protein
VIDVFSRMIVGWQFAEHMRDDLVLDALKMAVHLRGPGADVELVHHSDAGGQKSPCSLPSTSLLSLARVVTREMTTRAGSNDSAGAEAFCERSRRT